MRFRVKHWEVEFRITRLAGPCPMGGKLLPKEYHIRIIYGGTKEEPWPNYVSGCPGCGQAGFLTSELVVKPHIMSGRRMRGMARDLPA